MSIPAIPQSKPALTTLPKRRGIFDRYVSLRIKLPLIGILVLLLAILITTVINVRTTQSTLLNNMKADLNTQTDSKAEFVRSNLIWARTAAIDLAASAEVVNYDQDNILKAIQNTLVHNDQIFGSAIAYEPNQFKPNVVYWAPYYNRAPNNELKFTQLGNQEYDYFKREWYTLAKSKLAPTLSAPYFDNGGSEIWKVTWSVPFLDGTGKFKGVATADIAFSQTQNFVNQITVGKNGYAFLLDSHGKILGIGNNGGKYQVMVDSMVTAAQNSRNTGMRNLVTAMTNGETGFAKVTDPKGQPVFISYKPIGLNTGWSLGLAYPQAEFSQSISQLQATQFFYAFIVLVIFGALLYLLSLLITNPLRRLATSIGQFSPEQLSLAKNQQPESIQIHTRDELEDLSTGFRKITTDMVRRSFDFVERLAERTREIERRSNLLKAVADVGKAITSYRDLNELLQQTTYLIHENFGYYHIGIFLLDEYKEYAVLRATNSEGGHIMLEKNHKLKVGETGLVGYVTQFLKARIALDVGTDAVYFNNPDLPQTRSEMALPLVIGGQVLGALDVQSTESQAFSEEDSSTLQILAEQLAVAIQNVRLFAETEKALETSRTGYSQVSREAWSKILRSQQQIGYIATSPITMQTNTGSLEAGIAKAFETGDVIIGSDNLTISVPVKVRGLAIGAIRLKKAEISEAWTQEETNLAIALADQLSGALESARLYRESQQRGARESLVSDITARISAISSTESILRETVQELGQTLGNASVTFQLLNEFDGHVKGQNRPGTFSDSARKVSE